MKNIIGILLLLSGMHLFSQSSEFRFKNINGIYGEIENVIPTSDGGKLVVAGYDSLCLVKLNSINQVIWAKTILDNVGGLDIELIEKNSNYFISFQTWNTSFTRVYLLKFNNSGQLMFGKQIEYNNFSIFNPYEKSTVSINNTDEIIVSSQIKDYLTCLKLDNSGNQIYSKKIYTDTIHYINNGYSSVILNNGGAMLTGLSDTACVIVQLDPMGGFILAKAYHFDNSTSYYPNKIIKSKDMNYLISGYSINMYTSNQSPFLIKIDSLGNLIWYNQYTTGIGSNENSFTDLTELSNKNILIYYESMYALIETDSSGNVIAKRALAGGCKNIHSKVNEIFVNNYDNSVVINNSITHSNCSSNDSLIFNLVNTITSNTFVTNTYAKVQSFGTTYNYPFIIKNTNVTIEETCNMVGIEEVNLLDNIKIYPNPTTSILNIVDENNQFQNSTIQIKNYLGQVVFTSPFTNQIDISALSSGMYFLTFHDKNNIETVKVTKN